MPSRFTTFVRLAGHLTGLTRTMLTNRTDLRKALAAELDDNVNLSKLMRGQTFEAADVFSESALDKASIVELRTLAAQTVGPQQNSWVFRREVPLRSITMNNSVPNWGVGVALSRTIGPCLGKDGRYFWFDFYEKANFITFYVEGQDQPLLYLALSMADLINAFPIGPRQEFSFDLSAGSIWINAKLFHNSVPDDSFVGIKIKGGKLSFKGKPNTLPRRVILGKTHELNITVNPISPTAGAGSSTTFGTDARNSSVTLPNSFNFELIGGKLSILNVASTNWKLFGQTINFTHKKDAKPEYSTRIDRIIIPFTSSVPSLEVNNQQASYYKIDGQAQITMAGWALSCTQFGDGFIGNSASAGAMAVRCAAGLDVSWKGLDGGPMGFKIPWFTLEPGQLEILDVAAQGSAASQKISLWPNQIGESMRSNLEFNFTNKFTLQLLSSTSGYEMVNAKAKLRANIDKPIACDGLPVQIQSKEASLIFYNQFDEKVIYVEKENILLEQQKAGTDTFEPELSPSSFALQNVLFQTTPVNGFAFYGKILDAQSIALGQIFISFGMLGFLPTLPDPYAANLEKWASAFAMDRNHLESSILLRKNLSVILIAHLTVKDADIPSELSFYFGLIQPGVFLYEPFITPFPESTTNHPWTKKLVNLSAIQETTAATRVATRNLEAEFNKVIARVNADAYLLFDISGQADQMGVSLNFFPDLGEILIGPATMTVFGVQTSEAIEEGFPLSIQGDSMVAEARQIQTVFPAQISWEPMTNLAPPPPPPPASTTKDPPVGNLYAADDGGPTRISGLHQALIPIAPIPNTDHLVRAGSDPTQPWVWSLFTLPFGMKALTEFQRRENSLSYSRPEFPNGAKGGRQVALNGRKPTANDWASLPGLTLQYKNYGRPLSQNTFSVLGDKVTLIFNNNFFPNTLLEGPRNKVNLGKLEGVPIERIDFSGYGASLFSHWQDPGATIADVSQVKFDVWVGRTALETIQVRSLLYPWGIKVVRTINIYRLSDGKIYRNDSGWQAESEGLFDFSYKIKTVNTNNEEDKDSPYTIHKGIVKGIFNIRNIRETDKIEPFTDKWFKAAGQNFFNEETNIEEKIPTGSSKTLEVLLAPVYFDGDFDVEGLDGEKLLSSRGVLGYVQIAPRGEPISEELLKKLFIQQSGSIGGKVDGLIQLAETKQQMRLHKIDLSVATKGNSIAFVAAARGSVIFPKEGSWSVIQHNEGSGEVQTLAQLKGVPLIRKNGTGQAWQIADPSNLLGTTSQSMHYAFLQDTGTQKMLFSKPFFKRGSQLLNYASAHFADAMNLLNSSSIFPNINDAFPIDLVNTGLEILEEGLQLKNGNDRIPKVEVPLKDKNFYLVDTEAFKIFIRYKNNKLGFGLNPLKIGDAESWQSGLKDIEMVVNLGPLEPLLTIKGLFDAGKGRLPAFKEPIVTLGSSEYLNPVVKILRLLQSLNGTSGDYADMLKGGLQIAFSNSANSWQYKFAATQELANVKFPMPLDLYENPAIPFKLAASLRLGLYFDAVLRASENPGDQLPTAGAFLEFEASTAIMVASLGVGSIYAIGQVRLRMAADTKAGLEVTMLFAFGVQIVVGIPGLGNASVKFLSGLTLGLSQNEITTGIFMSFEGRMNILSGLVVVVILIEAQGVLAYVGKETYSESQVSFAVELTVCWIFHIDYEKSWEERRRISG